MEYDKINGNVAFVDNTHEYFNIKNPSIKYTSVTTLIHKFTQPFDNEFWSAYKALERLIPSDNWKIEKKSLLATKKVSKELLSLYNISEDAFNKEQQDILDDWDKKNRESCERGTKIHLELENSFYGDKRENTLKKLGIGGKFDCKKDYTALDIEKGVYPEYLISIESKDGKLRIAGQIDLLIKNGNEITLADWKGLPLDTEIPTINGWSMLCDLKVGDIIFDKLGMLTKILHKSKIHYNPCYRIEFTNGNSIIADHEHKWEISFRSGEKVMTTEEIKIYLSENPEETPRIKVSKPLYLDAKDLPIDPYVFGSSLLMDSVEIPNVYQRASFKQRLSLIRSIVDKFGKFSLGKCIITVKNKYQDIIKLLSTFGVKSSIHRDNDLIKIIFNSNAFSLITDIDDYYSISKIIPVTTIPTQCLEVDSPTHTFLCTKSMIVTHNTNKEIKTKGTFNTATKSTYNMKYPLNNLPDINFYHYTLQLSTYAWILQQLNPNFIIKDLILYHFDHNGKETMYHCEYLKEDVMRMLAFYKKEVIKEEQRNKRKRIEY